MLKDPPLLKPRRPRRRPRLMPPPPPGEPLTLVAGAFVAGPVLYLTFDRPVDASGLVAAAIVVDDGDSLVRYDAGGAVSLDAPETVRMELTSIGAGPPAAGVLLTAAANSGIVAVDDGGTWPGVTDYVLSTP